MLCIVAVILLLCIEVHVKQAIFFFQHKEKDYKGGSFPLLKRKEHRMRE
jgi:hypothetical protein